MAFPVAGNNIGSGVDQLKAQIRTMIRDEIRSAQRGGAGLHVDGATGDLVADRGQFRSLSYVPGAAGWGLQPSGNAEFNALTLRTGIIPNDALVAFVAPAAVNQSATAFALTTTWAEVVGLDLTVPAGCSRLLVTATGWVYATNNSAAADNLNTRVSLAATDGQAFLTPLPVAGFNTISAGLAVLASSLVPGTTVHLKVSAKTTTGPWTSGAANTATLVASLTWLR